MKAAISKGSFFLVAVVATQALFAQSRAPNIGYMYPAGGMAGTSVDAVVGGMNFQGIVGGYVSGDGVVVESAEFENPLGRLSNDLRNELRPIVEALQKGEDPIAASLKSTEKMLERLKKQAEKGEEDNKKADSGKKGEKGKVPDASEYDKMLKIVPGERLLYSDKTPEEVVRIIKALPPLEYQCLCKEILTRPNALQTTPAIDQKAIVRLKIRADAKPGPREIRLLSQQGVSNPFRFIVEEAPETTQDYFTPEKKKADRIESFPRTMNGEIMPGEVDKYKFRAKAGEAYLFSVKARELVPYLGDAVPGWFQAVLSVHGSNGAMLAYCDDNLFDPDPALVFTPPAAGEYEIRIRDSIYRGREDFVYRLKAEKIQNPPKTELKKPPIPYEIRGIGEREDNNSQRKAQVIPFPALIQGAIGVKNDTDCFLIDLGKGQRIAVEVFARRLGSPMDSLVQVLDAKSKVLQWNDDADFPNIGLQTHHADSRCTFEAPENGKYCIRVSDAQSKGGREYEYSLRIDTPRPDFSVYMMPSALNAYGATIPFKLMISRREGFAGTVEITVKDGPSGLKVDGSRIPQEADEILMTLSLPPGTTNGFHTIKLAAVATVAGKTVEREVVPADEVMQAFIYMHLLPASENILYIPKKVWALPFRNLPNEITIKPGESKELVFNCPNHKSRDADMALELMSPPPGVSVTGGKLEGGQYAFTLRADSKAKNWKGNLVFHVFSENRNKKGSRWLAGCLPAIPAKVN